MPRCLCGKCYAMRASAIMQHSKFYTWLSVKLDVVGVPVGVGVMGVCGGRKRYGESVRVRERERRSSHALALTAQTRTRRWHRRPAPFVLLCAQ